MGLDYQGRPQFARDRELDLSSVDRNRLSTFLDTVVETQSKEDTAFDSITKTYLKGEALRSAIAEMNPAGFIPVEPESSVRIAIQRLYPTNSNYDVITFGMFKTACDFLASQSANINEDSILKFNVVDPKIENSTVTNVYKSVNNNGADWISCFLEHLSPWAGMMIAGKMADLSFVISPQLDVNSEGGTGAFKSWGLQGMPIAIALMLELGLTIHEYNKFYKNNSAIPDAVKNQFDELCNSPDKREAILNAAGFDYQSLRANQAFNDHKAIKEYSIEWINRNQDDLNYHHWLSYQQVTESQVFVRSAAAMSPTFSNKWRRFYSVGSDSLTSTQTDVTTVETEQNAVPAILNTGLYTYINELSAMANIGYDKTYQSLAYRLDPLLVCCLVWYLGPMDTNVLRQLSRMLQLAVMGLSFNMRDLMATIGSTALTAYTNMLCHYLSHILHHVCSDMYNALFRVPDSHYQDAIKDCPAIGVLLNINAFALNFVVDYIDNILINLKTFVNSMTSRQVVLSSSIAQYRSIVALSRLLDQVANDIDRTQSLCTVKTESDVSFNDEIADKTLNFVVTVMPTLYPVIKVAETDRRKHFSDIEPISLKDFGIEIPGTDENGVSNVYTNTNVQRCGEEGSANRNIALGKTLAEYIKGN
jgi:hypothetical protein